MSRLSKVRARKGHTDRQTDKHRQTELKDYQAAFTCNNNNNNNNDNNNEISLLQYVA